eukprot:TRINITY_DN7182_c0_g1_i4.p1 TRINITY_DN7182_c0_g1~~TRINITY_DN7182_c0_g1_i4.p1  ORF type:complete len:1122 (-),score=344.81 TRINITY_DN7182_c0_g1_i4:23-3388(-)
MTAKVMKQVLVCCLLALLAEAGKLRRGLDVGALAAEAAKEATALKAEKTSAAEATAPKTEKTSAAEATASKTEKTPAAEATALKAEKTSAAEATAPKTEKTSAAEATASKTEKTPAAEATALKAEKTSAAEVEVRKAKTDKRSYYSTKFDSGLDVLLVQNPDAQKVSYAVAVEAGSMNDPKDFQGLAHFCEHMVFLGSKKYPGEDDFSNKLALHGGENNAYTSSEQTVYFAEVGKEGFEDTFDIFAQFFIEPTFAKSSVDKEIHAVDSEHKKNMPDMSRRLWHLLHATANPESPVSKFATGNLKTLKTDPEKDGKSLEEALHKYHKENYCPSRMHLVIMSNSSVEEQLKAAHASFDILEKRKEGCTERPIYEDIPMYSHELGNLGRQLTLKSPGTPELWLTFPMPPLRKHYKEHAELCVEYAMSHYGPGGLKALLKQEDLTSSYSAFFDTSVAGSKLMIQFSLTQNGLENKDKIMEYFFAYFNKIRAAGIDKDIFDKVQAMNQVSFDYAEQSSSESSIVTALAGKLADVDPADVLTAGSLVDVIDLELAQKVLDSVVADNMNVMLVSPDFDEKSGSKYEQYYDFHYADEALGSELLKRLKDASGFGLQPPPSLKYVPTNLELVKEKTEKETPDQLMKQDDGVELWWLGLGRFELPKVKLQMKLGYPRHATKTAARGVLAAMHSRLVNMALEAKSDALLMCGMSYGIATGKDGMDISFSGFDEHIVELVRLVLPVVREPGNPSSEFEMARRQMALDLSDITRQQPYEHAMSAFDAVMVKGAHTREALLKAAEDSWQVNPSAHKDFLEDIFAKSSLKVLVTGNMGKQRSVELAKEARKALGIGQPIEPDGIFGSIRSGFRKLVTMGTEADMSTLTEASEAALYPTLLNPEKEVEIRVGNPIPEDPNSATIVAYQFGIPRLADRIRFSMISGIIERPVFQILRTEHQLGYVVFGYVTAHQDVLEVRVLVQGFRETPDSVEKLIESTVQNLTSTFAALDENEFATRKETLRKDLIKPPSNLGDFAGKYWKEIWDETYCFDKREKEVKLMDSEEFKDPKSLLEAWKHTTQAHRKKVTVKLFGADQATGRVTIPEVASGRDRDVVTDVEDLSALSAENRWPHHFICE